MTFAEYFPVWQQLTPEQQALLNGSVQPRHFNRGDVIHRSAMECTGLLLLRSGQLRAYILSEEGREITIYRLFDRDMCLFSASCIMRSIQFDISIEAEKDTDAWLIPPDIYRQVMEQSPAVANYTNELMASRFSEVMWLMEQVMWKSMDQRLATFLLEESALEGSRQLRMTHEVIANHLGTHREVITRMLRYFQSEGLVRLQRGCVELLDEEKLEALTHQPSGEKRGKGVL